MSLNYHSVDAGLVEHVNSLSKFDPSEHAVIIMHGLELLEGKAIDFAIVAMRLAVTPNKVHQLCLAISALFWECTKKLSARETQSLKAFLEQINLSETLSQTFNEVYNENRKRIMLLKGSLGVSTYSYHNIAWRLDVELSRRNMRVLHDPKYMIRLDLLNRSTSITAENADTSKSVHLQADYANLKLLQRELQKALDEFASVHCQRLNKYIT